MGKSIEFLFFDCTVQRVKLFDFIASVTERL